MARRPPGRCRGRARRSEKWLDRWPDEPEPLERLATLTAEAGDTGHAAELCARKAEVDRSLERFQALLTNGDPLPHAAEMARLALALGWRAQARGWAALALRRNPGDADTRALLLGIENQPEPASALGATLADLVGDLEPMATASRPGSPSMPKPAFVDNTETAGLALQFDRGRSTHKQLPMTMCGGIGLIDFDGDGNLDVYAVQGGALTQHPDPEAPPAGDRLYRNLGDGTFEDVTDRSGLGEVARGYGHGVAVGDVDSDGHPDLFVTRLGAYRLYRNRGDGTFEDVTEPRRVSAATATGRPRRRSPTSTATATSTSTSAITPNWDADPPENLPTTAKRRPSRNASPGRSPPCPTTSSATTAVSSST